VLSFGQEVSGTQRWEAINAVQRVQDYIEAHVHEPISLSQLARAAGYSQWHLVRIFKELLDMTPFEYLRALRLSKAALALRDGKKRVVDVAFDFVFDSHEGFTRAFSRQFGVSPKRYSQSPQPIPLFMPHRVRDYYLTLQKGEQKMPKTEKTRTVFVQVVERPARKVILKRGVKATHYFEYCEEVGCDIWGILSSIKEAMYEPIGMWLPPSLIAEGTSQYAQGVEVPLDYAGKVPEGFDIIELPPCKMMVFQGEPFADEEFEEAIQDLWDVMRRYKPETYGFAWDDEAAPRFQLAPEGYRGYIEARPVREINQAADKA
jgi:AraC family transcriptional regulator